MLKNVCSCLSRFVSYIAFFVFIATLISLAFVDIRPLVHQIPHYHILKANIDFLAAIISNYGGLIITFSVISLLFYLAFNFRVNVAEFNLLGTTLSLKDQEGLIKSQIKNYLNTKRSMFHFLEDYDNIYNVMKSWYEILNFVRSQLSRVENGRELSKELDKRLQCIVLELNAFLTKYHSDYRRWFEWRLKREEEKDSFTPFVEIQKDYSQYTKMLADIKELNVKMREYGDYFGVNYDKWIYDKWIRE